MTKTSPLASRLAAARAARAARADGRNRRLVVLVTAAEKRAAREAAMAHGVTVSELLRALLETIGDGCG